MSLVEARHLRRLYQRAGKTLAAVDNVDFTLKEGESVSLMGRSGSGKTTFLGLLTGLISPTSGEILLEGRKLFALPDAEASSLRARLIGYVPQGQSLIPALNALDNVRLPCFLAGKAETEKEMLSAERGATSQGTHEPQSESISGITLHGGFLQGDKDEASANRALELLRAVGLDHLRESLPKDMSGGEMRRVAIARALMLSPRLLVADEPTSDLDEENAEMVMNLLAEANAQGTALLVATHDRRLAGFAKRRLKMDAGRLAAE